MLSSFLLSTKFYNDYERTAGVCLERQLSDTGDVSTQPDTQLQFGREEIWAEKSWVRSLSIIKAAQWTLLVSLTAEFANVVAISRFSTNYTVRSSLVTMTMVDQVASHLERLSLQSREELPIVFSEEQKKFIDLAVDERRNLLLVAPAGYGKSAVIKTVIERLGRSLRSVNRQPVCALCAPTGKAASLIGGRTLHSYLGIGRGDGSANDWIKRVHSKIKTTLRGVQVILIDEISMVSADFLDKISKYLQLIRDNHLPFGGVQMILVGDLCQLPPVKGDFVFRSAEFARGKFQPYQFTECFRQNDSDFINLLNEVRFARCSEQTMETLRKCTTIDPDYANGLSPMQIVSTNEEVDSINRHELREFVRRNNDEVAEYRVRIPNSGNMQKAKKYQNAANIPELVEIAVGCQVVVTQNIGHGIVNGTQGYITAANLNSISMRLQDGNIATIEYFDFKDPEHPDVFQANTLFSYLPVRLGYASTVHKAQGMTLKLLEVDFKRTFAHGQLYTAISRVTDLRGLIVKNLTQSAFICNRAVVEFYDGLE